MPTFGAATFNPDLAEVIEEAYERCGVEMRAGYEYRTARRSLNLLFVEWANRGINLWTLDMGEIALEKSKNTYEVPLDTVDVLDMVLRTYNAGAPSDLALSRISATTYSTIPNKASTGRPLQVWVQRRSGAFNPDNTYASPSLTLWPTPDAPYVLVYWRLRRIQDADGSGATTMDVPFRFFNCMIAGLAYYLSLKVPGIDPNRMMALKADYTEQLDLAMSEDREKASLYITPRIGR